MVENSNQLASVPAGTAVAACTHTTSSVSAPSAVAAMPSGSDLLSGVSTCGSTAKNSPVNPSWINACTKAAETHVSPIGCVSTSPHSTTPETLASASHSQRRRRARAKAEALTTARNSTTGQGFGADELTSSGVTIAPTSPMPASAGPCRAEADMVARPAAPKNTNATPGPISP